jgi:predicted nucleotidyltransferase
MAERREKEQQYSSLRKGLGNFLRENTGLRVSGVALMGSRRRGDHNADSDMDVIFTVAGDPSKDQVYPGLIDKLTRGMNVQARLGSSHNVIKIQKGDLKVDLVLRTEEEYREQKRRQNLEEL